MYRVDNSKIYNTNSTVDRLVREHGAIRSDLQRLRSQLHEVCSQAVGTDNNLCSRIHASPSSINNNGALHKTSDPLNFSLTSPALAITAARQNAARSRNSFTPIGVETVTV
ncbi:ORF-105 [Buzura suppressaria nucleopolyhedrovirus]|uniref:ORF-105 n=1 Tax=Buzura suppressaria nuclear polyhedrosis virus TaxID=74320 RepID=W5VLD0_NPVBS|nr:ORF-105 [Buzura suppressaria nucleopolyhedrovirus]AHH82694.1 ORF-105 [Buzura suppressaria nucleopolyhedrovirus]AKN91078.1 ORF-108 [Buzura suppressaria nucleopolyhedrovirus]QYF10648.1 hypothetical protein [Buzura suppressaria nucleopolyhedrovirus]